MEVLAPIPDFLVMKDSKGFEFLIDQEDFEKVSQFKWNVAVRLTKSKKSIRKEVQTNIVINGKWTTIGLGRFLLNPPKGMHVDHINLDTTDNRRANIRIVTQAQNNQNKRGSGQFSKYRGVSLSRENLSKRWKAFASIKGKKTNLGYFSTEKEAAQAYNKAIIESGKEYARLNDV